MHEYKIGDPVRVKETGWMGYYNGFYKSMYRLVSEKNMCSESSIDPIYVRQVAELNEIEPLPLRHPYFGKKVIVWDKPEKKVKRILIDVNFIYDGKTNVLAVADWCEELFFSGREYDIIPWNNWEPLPEKTEHQQKLDQLTQRPEATQQEVDAIKAEIKELRNE